MRDDDEGTGPPVEGLLQFLDEREGQVIGRFVEQEQVGGAGEQPREGESAALPGGERTHGHVSRAGARRAEPGSPVPP